MSIARERPQNVGAGWGEQQPNGPIRLLPTRPPIQNVSQLFLSLTHNIILKHFPSENVSKLVIFVIYWTSSFIWLNILFLIFIENLFVILNVLQVLNPSLIDFV